MNRKGVVILGKYKIGSGVRICPGTVIGKPYRPLIDAQSENQRKTTIIKKSVYVGYYSIIGAGSTIESGAVLDDFSVIESDVHVGKKSLVIYRGQLCNGARVGKECVIGGLVGERVVVGNHCRVFGKVVHSQRNLEIPWDAHEGEGSASIADGVFIGFNATVIGNIEIGKGAYICAGAVLTKNVPAWHVVSGINEIVPCEEWKGELPKFLSLRKSRS